MRFFPRFWAVVEGFTLQAGASNQWEFLTGDDSTADGNFDVLAGSPVQLNTWTHLAATFDAQTGTKTLYVNGVAAATTNTQQYVPTTTNNLFIGGSGNTGHSDRLTGRIDDVSLWSLAPPAPR